MMIANTPAPQPADPSAGQSAAPSAGQSAAPSAGQSAAPSAGQPTAPSGLPEALTETSAQDLARLHRTLEQRADDEGVLDIAYRVVDSPVGSLLLATSARGLIRVAFQNEDHDSVLERLAHALSPRILNAPHRLDAAARELDEYFAGRRSRFDLTLDLSLSHGFRLTVLDQLPRIAYGSTQSYSQVAQAAGSPRAVRAVGSACATNPLPIIVPCHRVLRSDGSLGGYVGGLDAKRTLLDLESAAA